MVTPLRDDGSLDREGTARLIEHLIAGGVHGIFILGTTGEAQSLPYEIRYQLTELACHLIGGRVPVLVGISDTSFEESLRLARRAAECGAAGVVSTAPYYFPPSQQEMIEYFTAVADASPLPLYLYNMPSHVKVSLDPATVETLARHPNIAGLKDSSSSMVYFQHLLHRLHYTSGFALFVGPEKLTAECVKMGAAGGVNGGANLFPELYVKLYEAASAGKLDRMKVLQQKVVEVGAALYGIGRYDSSYLKGLKTALSLRGLCNDYMAYPFRRFRAEERTRVREALERLGCPIENP